MSLYTREEEKAGTTHAELIRHRISELTQAMIVCYSNLQSYLNHPHTTQEKVRKALGKSDEADLEYLMGMFHRMAKRIHPDVHARLKYITKQHKDNAVSA